MEASNNDNMLIYQSEDGKIKIDVRFENETVWLSLDQMATLFGRDKSTISRHIKNVFEEGELPNEATVANFATVQVEGNREVVRNIDYYNLDVIISVGYRVKSQQGTQFRIWATQRTTNDLRPVLLTITSRNSWIVFVIYAFLRKCFISR